LGILRGWWVFIFPRHTVVEKHGAMFTVGCSKGVLWGGKKNIFNWRERGCPGGGGGGMDPPHPPNQPPRFWLFFFCGASSDGGMTATEKDRVPVVVFENFHNHPHPGRGGLGDPGERGRWSVFMAPPKGGGKPKGGGGPFRGHLMFSSPHIRSFRQLPSVFPGGLWEAVAPLLRAGGGARGRGGKKGHPAGGGPGTPTRDLVPYFPTTPPHGSP